MNVPSVNLEKYLRFLSDLLKERWDNRANAEFEDRDELTDEGSRIWLEMTGEEHEVADHFVALYHHPISAPGSVNKEPLAYTHEMGVAACLNVCPPLRDYLEAWTKVFLYRWSEDTVDLDSANDLVDKLHDELTQSQLEIAEMYIDIYFNPLVGDDGDITSEPPRYLPFREQHAKNELARTEEFAANAAQQKKK